MEVKSRFLPQYLMVHSWFSRHYNPLWKLFFTSQSHDLSNYTAFCWPCYGYGLCWWL